MRTLLRRTADLAADYLESVDERPVYPQISTDELYARLSGPLPDGPSDPAAVVEELARAADPGVVASAGGRYHGFVIGGAVPAATAADWLASAWDQDAGLWVLGPAVAVAEEVSRGWLADLLGLPPHVSAGLVPRGPGGEGGRPGPAPPPGVRGAGRGGPRGRPFRAA